MYSGKLMMHCHLRKKAAIVPACAVMCLPLHCVPWLCISMMFVIFFSPANFGSSAKLADEKVDI